MPGGLALRHCVSIFFPEAEIVDGPLVQVRLVAVPFPAAVIAQTQVGCRVEIKTRQLPPPVLVVPVSVIAMPQMRYGPLDIVYAAAHVSINPITPGEKVFQLPSTLTHQARDAGRIPIPAHCMGHKVVSGPGQTDVVQPMME